jgi:hypothetical protein
VRVGGADGAEEEAMGEMRYGANAVRRMRGKVVRRGRGATDWRWRCGKGRSGCAGEQNATNAVSTEGWQGARDATNAMRNEGSRGVGEEGAVCSG